MTACRDKPVCRIIAAGQGAIRQHVAIRIIADRAAVEHNKSVVGVVLEAAVRRIGNVACRVVREALGRDDTIAVQTLDCSCRYATQAIISITDFGSIYKSL